MSSHLFVEENVRAEFSSNNRNSAPKVPALEEDSTKLELECGPATYSNLLLILICATIDQKEIGVFQKYMLVALELMSGTPAVNFFNIIFLKNNYLNIIFLKLFIKLLLEG